MNDIILILAISFLAFFSFINLFILIYLSAFIVRLHGFLSDFLGKLNNKLEIDEEKEIPEEFDDPLKNDINNKTWDQKYEEELNIVEKLKREKGKLGLIDI